MSCRGCKKKKSGLITRGEKIYESLPDDAKKIAGAYLNLLKEDPRIEIVATARERICRDCPEMKEVLGQKVCGVSGYMIAAVCRCMDCNCPSTKLVRWKKVAYEAVPDNI